MTACSVAIFAPGFAQDASTPTNLVEGAPDATVVIDGSSSALENLAAGDAAWAESKREVAFDAWRSAIVASAEPESEYGGGTIVAPPPGHVADVDGTLARRAEDGAWSVRRRLAALAPTERAAWRTRFEPLAEIERAFAGHVPDRLARVQREFPRTRGAALAALTLADLAAERGDTFSASAWLRRALADANDGDTTLRSAIEQRRTFERMTGERVVGEQRTAIDRDDVPVDFWGLSLRKYVHFDAAVDPRDATVPGIAFDARGDDATWYHAGGRLLRFDANGGATAALDVLAAAREVGVDTGPAFSEPGAVWDERFALWDERFALWDERSAFSGDVSIALVAGRARAERGNALLGIDTRTTSTPRIAWARDSNGLVQGGARVESAALAAAPLAFDGALLEFQPGPLRVGEVLVVHVRAWPRGAERTRTELDEARVESWCAGLDPRTGERLWSRRLATGSTRRGMDRGRMDVAESTSLPALPLAAGGHGMVAIDTGLGAVALLDAIDGRMAWILRTARRGDRPAAVGGIVFGEPASDAGSESAPTVWFAPAASTGALLELAASADEDGFGILRRAPLVLDEPRIPIAAQGTAWFALAPAARGVQLAGQDLATGWQMRSAVLPFARLERGSVAAAAWPATRPAAQIVSAGGRLYLLDGGLVDAGLSDRGLRVRAELELGPRADFARTAIAVGVDRAGRHVLRVAGTNGLAFATAP